MSPNFDDLPPDVREKFLRLLEAAKNQQQEKANKSRKWSENQVLSALFLGAVISGGAFGAGIELPPDTSRFAMVIRGVFCGFVALLASATIVAGLLELVV